jgi:hypothetical protein
MVINFDDYLIFSKETNEITIINPVYHHQNLRSIDFLYKNIVVDNELKSYTKLNETREKES